MRKIPRKIWLSILAIACVVWAFETQRPEALLLTLFFLFALLSRSFRRSNTALLSTALMIFVFPFSPIGITTMYAPGWPKLVTCCPNNFGRPHQIEIVEEDVRLGKCAFCTDIVTGFEAKQYLVW